MNPRKIKLSESQQVAIKAEIDKYLRTRSTMSERKVHNNNNDDNSLW